MHMLWRNLLAVLASLQGAFCSLSFIHAPLHTAWCLCVCVCVWCVCVCVCVCVCMCVPQQPWKVIHSRYARRASITPLLSFTSTRPLSGTCPISTCLIYNSSLIDTARSSLLGCLQHHVRAGAPSSHISHSISHSCARRCTVLTRISLNLTLMCTQMY